MQPEHAPEAAAEGFNAGTTIIEHVSNSSLEHPLIHLPTHHGRRLLGHQARPDAVDRRRHHLRGRDGGRAPLPEAGPAGALGVHERARARGRLHQESIVRPNVGDKWVGTWTPLLVTLFLFILGANVIGLIPIFDVLALLNHTVLHAAEDRSSPRSRTAASPPPATST